MPQQCIISYMIGVIPFQEYGFLHVILAQALNQIHIWPEHARQKKYMNGGCGHYVHSTRTFFAVNMEV